MTGVSAVALDAIFARRGWLSHQPADFRRAVVGQGRSITLGAGDPVFHAGDAGGGIYGIVSGSIGCEVTTPLSGPTLVHILQAGAWFGEGPMLFDRPRTMGFMALEKTAVLLVPLHAIRGLETADGQAIRRLGQLAEVAAMTAIDAGCELLIRDARQRIAAVLLRVTAVADGVVPADPRGFCISQAQLAEMSNVSRHHTNVALLELQATGHIALDYRRVAVLNSTALQRFAASGSPA